MTSLVYYRLFLECAGVVRRGEKTVFYYANPPPSLCKNSATRESKSSYERYNETIRGKKSESRMVGTDKRTSQTCRTSKTILFQLIIRIVTIHSVCRRILPRHVNSEWRQSSNSSVARGRCVIHRVSGWENVFVRMPGNNKGHSPPPSLLGL